MIEWAAVVADEVSLVRAGNWCGAASGVRRTNDGVRQYSAWVMRGRLAVVHYSAVVRTSMTVQRWMYVYYTMVYSLHRSSRDLTGYISIRSTVARHPLDVECCSCRRAAELPRCSAFCLK